MNLTLSVLLTALYVYRRRNKKAAKKYPFLPGKLNLARKKII